MSTQPSSLVIPPGDGDWIESWLSGPRLARYLGAANGDRARALQLYEWNAQLSAAFQRDLGHLEVALRNAYDDAASRWGGSGHWLLDGSATVFAPQMRRGSDVNAKPRDQVAQAIRIARGPKATSDKVVAELSFGFWRYLSSSAHEKSLWVPYLHRAFPPGTNRSDVDARVGRLHGLRNRVAHHEALLTQDLAGRLSDLFDVADALYPELGLHLRSTSTVPALVAQRP